MIWRKKMNAYFEGGYFKHQGKGRTLFIARRTSFEREKFLWFFNRQDVLKKV